MLRIPLLQQWYALSSPAFKEELHEIPPLRRFAQLGGLDNISDENTILTFVACWRPSSRHPAQSKLPIERSFETYQNKKSIIGISIQRRVLAWTNFLDWFSQGDPRRPMSPISK